MRNISHMKEIEVRVLDAGAWHTLDAFDTEREALDFVRLAAAGRYRVCMFSGRILHEIING